MDAKNSSPLIGRAKNNYPYLLAIVFFILFKMLYPRPDLFLDSVNYLQWGLDDYPIAFRPLGYTDFLMFFNGSGNNYITLVVMQFAVFLVSSYFFLETIFKLLNPSNAIKWVCWVGTIFNPFSYYLINLISPDCLFISFSALWMASLLRFIFFEKSRYIFLAVHILTFFFLFYLRYNALYYPFFAAGIILLCRMQRTLKIAGIAGNLIIFFLLYNSATQKAEDEMGVKILSGFGGWVMANNAIHLYNVTKVDSTIFEDNAELALHRYVLADKDSAHNYAKQPIPTDQYMWSSKGPLKRYMVYNAQSAGYTSYLQAWWNQSVMYNDFGVNLIKHYPGAFFKAFYWPNFKQFFYPPAEVLTNFNFQSQKLKPEWQQYLGVEEEMFTSKYSDLQKSIIKVMEGIYAILSPICMLFSLIVVVKFLMLAIRTKFKVEDNALTAAFILALFYLATAALLIFAHPVLLRYISMLLIFFNILPFMAYKILLNKKATA